MLTNNLFALKTHRSFLKYIQYTTKHVQHLSPNRCSVFISVDKKLSHTAECSIWSDCQQKTVTNDSKPPVAQCQVGRVTQTKAMKRNQQSAPKRRRRKKKKKSIQKVYLFSRKCRKTY